MQLNAYNAPSVIKFKHEMRIMGRRACASNRHIAEPCRQDVDEIIEVNAGEHHHGVPIFHRILPAGIWSSVYAVQATRVPASKVVP